MELIVNNKIVTVPLRSILYKIRADCKKPLFNQIKDKGDNLLICCPSHKGGQESHPSCQIFNKRDDPNIQYGFCHCFTCGFKGSLPYLVSYCLDITINQSNQWLADNFGSVIDSNTYQLLPELIIHKEDKHILDPKILDKYNFYHPYLLNRGISKEVLDRFNVGFDPESDNVIFPVWDKDNNLVMITSRNIHNKFFYISNTANKPVYLLNFIEANNIKKVYVVESQINALTLWTWGLPAIALFGTGSNYQYNILNSSNIENYVLCFDGDAAGESGRERFIKNIRKDVLVSFKQLPKRKDVNDLTFEEFNNLVEYF